MTENCIPTFDAEGNVAGMFDMQGILDAGRDATKTAIEHLDADRGEMVHTVLQAVKNLEHGTQTFVLAGTIADLLEVFQGVTDVAEATGTPVRSKLREIWGIEGEGDDS